MITTDNTTVVAYINKQGGTHSHTLLRLVVDRVRVWVVMHVFHINSTVPTNSKYSHPGQTHSWLFKYDSGLTISAKPVESPPGNSEPNIHVYMFPLLPLLSQVIQKLRTTQEGEVILIAPWWPSQPWFPHHLLCLCLCLQFRSLKHWRKMLCHKVDVYMFPLFPLLSQVIQKLRTTQEGEVILIAPWWPSQPWFPHHLLCLCVDHPRFCPYRREILSQQEYVSSGKSYHLHAWRLSCSTTK